MSTPKEAAEMLNIAYQKVGSYRKLSALLGIPWGTLQRIVKSEGAYMPKVRKYRLILGVKEPRKTRPGKTIQTMSKKELEYLFAHRLDM